MMMSTDDPTYDNKGEDDDGGLSCDHCGRPMREDEDGGDWQMSAEEAICPHCAELAAAEGLNQAERQGD